MNESMLCTKTHEYVLEQDGKYEIGITDYAIEQLGDIVFVELPEVGSGFPCWKETVETDSGKMYQQ